jgi:hypothetical protein
MNWPKLSTQNIKLKPGEALGKNINDQSDYIPGIPAICLEREIFYDDAPFLKDAPFLSTLVVNANLIGSHILGHEREPAFNRTQNIDKNLIRICSDEIFSDEPNTGDDSVASGGKKANTLAKTFRLVRDHNGYPIRCNVIMMPHIKHGIPDTPIAQLSSKSLYKSIAS